MIGLGMLDTATPELAQFPRAAWKLLSKQLLIRLGGAGSVLTENCCADGHFGWYEGCSGWAVYIPELEMWHLRCLDD